MSEIPVEPLDPGELVPATGEPQPVDGWRAVDVDPDELVDDEWVAEHTTPLTTDAPEALERPRFGASGAGWNRDTVRRVAARTGYPVVEAWSSHDRGAMGTVVGPLIHHTGTAVTGADYPTLRVVRDGRPGLENSLCMFGLGRSGTVYLVSERLSWHAGPGEYGGVTDGNGHLAGIEAESDGRSWTAEQLDAYPRLVASILLEAGRGPEWTPRHGDYALPRGRKTDTSGLDIAALRATVARYLARPELINREATDMPLTPDEIERIADRVTAKVATAANPYGLDALLTRLVRIESAVLAADANDSAEALSAKLAPVLIAPLTGAVVSAVSGVIARGETLDNAGQLGGIVESALRRVLGGLDGPQA